MGLAIERRFGVRAVVRAMLVIVASVLSLSRTAQGEPLAPLGPPIVLEEAAEAPGVLVFPARVPGPRPVTVVLHGMCSEPERACRHFAEEITLRENLICPRATRRCDGGGSTWQGIGFEEKIEAAILRAKGALAVAPTERRGRTLIGYSLGAFRALALAERASGRYPRVMLIGARVYPNVTRLRNNGVVRLLLTAGNYDMTHDHMLRESSRLARTGFPARFLGLGPVGHAFTPSFGEYLPDAISWLHGENAGVHE